MPEQKPGRNPKKNTPQFTLRYWIERIEQQVNALLDGVDLDELNGKQRLELAIKYIGLLQRYYLIEQGQEQAQNSDDETYVQQKIIDLAEWMRTPPSHRDKTFEDEQEE
ncbi:hypothetical protein KSC_013140 [Ktedonobacter sp. SOSP1-52]|uniref:hypothetical protein n=1 Tax=Ktedonobacter sp. SOSP1-52 TaxID=2778366 RepID=UPI0019156D01|nr:hypothetical protein [Ktedonobacter sp. SOSP1-52]GHO62422.1 hypothetical protein KSC_013140 [Ktedonobacter sp. SOSP1-52]